MNTRYLSPRPPSFLQLYLVLCFNLTNRSNRQCKHFEPSRAVHYWLSLQKVSPSCLNHHSTSLKPPNFCHIIASTEGISRWVRSKITSTRPSLYFAAENRQILGIPLSSPQQKNKRYFIKIWGSYSTLTIRLKRTLGLHSYTNIYLSPAIFLASRWSEMKWSQDYLGWLFAWRSRWKRFHGALCWRTSEEKVYKCPHQACKQTILVCSTSALGLSAYCP